MTTIASTCTHLWSSLGSFFLSSVGAKDAPLSLLEELPQALQGELHNFMQLKTFCRLSRVSQTLRGRIFSIIATDPLLLSRVVQELVQYEDMEAPIEIPLNALSRHKNEKYPIPLSLTLPLDKVPLAEKIAKEFENIHTVTVLSQQNPFACIQAPIIPCQRLILHCGLHTLDFPKMPLLTSLKVINNAAWWALPDVAYVEYRSFGNRLNAQEIEEITGRIEHNPNGTRYGLLARYYKEKDPQKCKEFLKKSLELFPQCIQAQLDLASFENDAEQLKRYQEVVRCRPDIAEARVTLAKKLFPSRPNEAKPHFDKAIALYEKDEDIDALLDIATFLQSKELVHSIYDPKMPYKRNHRLIQGLTYRQLEKIIAIDPAHVFARFDYAERTFSRVSREVVDFCREQRHLPGLILLSYEDRGESPNDLQKEIACAARDALQGLDQELFTIFQRNHPSKDVFPFVEYFLQKGMPVEPLFWLWGCSHPWYVHRSGDVIVSYLIKKELQGGTLFDISFLLDNCDRHNGDRHNCNGRTELAILELLHRLEHQARSNPPDLLETVPEVFGEAFTDWDCWQVFLFLHKHDLYPHLRIQILEGIVEHHSLRFGEKPQFGSRNALFGAKGNFLIAADVKSHDASDDFYKAFSHPRYWEINAHIALAVLLLPEDRTRTRAIRLFESAIPSLLACKGIELLKAFEELFAKHSLFPEFQQEVRERTLDQALSKLSI